LTNPYSFAARFPKRQINLLCGAYEQQSAPHEDDLEATIAPAVRSRGFYTKREFLKTCYWKSPRSRPRCEANRARHIEIITRAALTSSVERVRIETLTTLGGVGWPTASVLLHFGQQDPYPILDFRALWSLGIDPVPAYDFEFWWAYVTACRALATSCGVSIRSLDRALWQYSKERQP
jgi:hypothetical protein